MKAKISFCSCLKKGFFYDYRKRWQGRGVKMNYQLIAPREPGISAIE